MQGNVRKVNGAKGTTDRLTFGDYSEQFFGTIASSGTILGAA
jgi:hypothetical protein